MRAWALAGTPKSASAATRASPRLTSARCLLGDLDHLLEGRPVDPVDQLLVDRADRPLAHRVEAPLVARLAVLRADVVGVELLGVGSERLPQRGQDARPAAPEAAVAVLR